MKYTTNNEEQPSTEKNTRANHCRFGSCLFGRIKNTFIFFNAWVVDCICWHHHFWKVVVLALSKLRNG